MKNRSQTFWLAAVFVWALVFVPVLLQADSGGGEALCDQGAPASLFNPDPVFAQTGPPYYDGAVTNLVDGMCYWSCYGGSAGSAPVSRPYVANCMYLCAAACGGPCEKLF